MYYKNKQLHAEIHLFNERHGKTDKRSVHKQGATRAEMWNSEAADDTR